MISIFFTPSRRNSIGISRHEDRLGELSERLRGGNLLDAGRAEEELREVVIDREWNAQQQRRSDEDVKRTIPSCFNASSPAILRSETGAPPEGGVCGSVKLKRPSTTLAIPGLYSGIAVCSGTTPVTCPGTD